jgi:hypothetical protein
MEGCQVSLALHKTNIHHEVVRRRIACASASSTSISTHRHSQDSSKSLGKYRCFQRPRGAARMPVFPPVSSLLARAYWSQNLGD